MPNIAIRPYGPADLDQCRSLWAEMTQHHRDIYDDPSIGGDDPGREFDEHMEKVGPECVLVATVDAEVAGLTSLMQNGEEAELEPVVVSSKHRDKGIGQSLVDHAVEMAKDRGVLCLSVKPVARNEKAISFFYEAGFRTLGHIQLFMWLGPPMPGQWRPGPVLFGKSLEY